MVGDENKKPHNRSFIKSQNNSNWKNKLRENCYKRVREDRTRLLWKLRLPEANNQSLIPKEVIRSTFEDIVSDELEKLKESSLHNTLCDSNLTLPDDDMIWEYDGLFTDNHHEEMLLEMQRIFYEDQDTQKELEKYTRTWEDEEDEYLAHAVFEHMNLSGKKVREIWCPICKQGELYQNSYFIQCSLCKLKLGRGDEVNLELLENQLAKAHTEHLDRGCRLKPEFCTETRFEITALYIKCQGCHTFEIVI